MGMVTQRGVTAATAAAQLGSGFFRRSRHLPRPGAMQPPGSPEMQRATARLGRLLSSLTPQSSASESVGAAATAAASPAAAAVAANKTAVPPTSGYRLPPPEIAAIVDTPPEPLLSFSPDRKTVLQLARPPANPPVSELARPELKLAGGSCLGGQGEEVAGKGMRYWQGEATRCEGHGSLPLPPAPACGATSLGRAPRHISAYHRWEPGPHTHPLPTIHLFPPTYPPASTHLPAGLRIDPESFSRSRMSYYTSITYAPFTDALTMPIPADAGHTITGIPDGYWVGGWVGGRWGWGGRCWAHVWPWYGWEGRPLQDAVGWPAAAGPRAALCWPAPPLSNHHRCGAASCARRSTT